MTQKDPGVAAALKAIFKPTYQTVEAVKEVSFEIDEGELVGFLGPNGAGKTTTLKMLSGILFPTSGEMSVLGFNPWQRPPALLKKMALVMGNKNQLWWDLPAMDSFVVLSEIYEMDQKLFKKRSSELIDVLDLGDKVNTQVRKLSLGERMKCELVAALLHRPSIIYLDEPTIGLDVVSQKRIRDFLSQVHRDEGSTIMLTSHYMQDVLELCDRVIVIDNGTKVFDGALEGLVRRFNEERTVALVLSAEVDDAGLADFGRVTSRDGLTVELAVPREATAQAVGRILAHLPVSDVQIHEPSIEEIVRKLFTKEEGSQPAESPAST